MSRKLALVTGATGFIGSHLCRILLKNGWKVRAALRTCAAAKTLDKAVEPHIVGDICGNPDWSAAISGVDTVFHLAGKAHDTTGAVPSSEYQAVNVHGTVGLLKACGVRQVRRLVFFSSIKAMSDQTNGPQDESFLPSPLSPYGKSKLQAEREVVAAVKSSCLTSISLRLSLVYGPGQKGNLLKLVRQIDRGFFPGLRWADNRRSLVHIDNVVQAALLAAESTEANGQAYIVTDSEPYSTATICRLIRQGLGKGSVGWDLPPSVFKLLARMGDVIGRVRGRPFPFDSETYKKLFRDSWYSCEKISRDLGYAPTMDLQRAIPDIIAFYREGGLQK